MSDAASIGAQTHAPVVGGPPTAEKLMTQAIPKELIKAVTGKGGEAMRFDGFTVEPILGRHGEPNPQVGQTVGKAIDFFIPGVPLEKVRASALRVQGGGVGYYPTSGSPFVHLDVGSIRHWPRMTHDQLAKVFPDGRTVHVPSDGRPLSGYALALADVRQRLDALGFEPVGSSPEEFRKFLRADFDKWGEIIRIAKIHRKSIADIFDIVLTLSFMKVT